MTGSHAWRQRRWEDGAIGRIDDYRASLAGLADWMPFLAANSGLPGPRGNLELVAACGEEADASRAGLLIASGDEFATVCGLVTLGRLLGRGDDAQVSVLHGYASDERWRVREGVAMALQRAAADDPARAFTVAERWANDPDALVRRAAVAAVCEPRLIRDPSFARRALRVVERVTAALAELPPNERRVPSVRTLRQALGYAWSVAIAAIPDVGLPSFRQLAERSDADLQWIVHENLKKHRLKRLLDTGR